MTRIKAAGFVAGLVGVISLLLILHFFGAFDHIRTDREGAQATATITEEATEEATEEPTEEPATEQVTEEATLEPTSVPTEEATEEATEEPTEAPTQEPTSEPAVQANWQVVEDESGEPVNQAMVWLAFNEDEPAQVYWSNQDGSFDIQFEAVPNLGQNGLGYAVFEDRSADRLKTEVWFQLDESGHTLILVDSLGQALKGPVKLFNRDQAGGIPQTWAASQVWSGCVDEECATEIAQTSGYFRLDEEVTCRESILESPQGSFQRYRMGNGLSVVESTQENPNFIDPRWSDGTEGISGWECGNEQETIFVVNGCGNIAIAAPRE